MPSAYCTSLPRSGKCVNHASAAGERKRCTSSTLSQRTSDASVMSSAERSESDDVVRERKTDILDPRADTG